MKIILYTEGRVTPALTNLFVMQKQELVNFLMRSENNFFVIGFHRSQLEKFGYFVLGEFETEEEAEECAMPFLEAPDVTRGVTLWWREEGSIYSYGGKVN